jgi:hypothetical protein
MAGALPTMHSRPPLTPAAEPADIESGMAISEKDRLLLEWSLVRDDAEALLEALRSARADSERRQAELRQKDPLKKVTGRSMMDSAIDRTQRMIDTLNRQIADLEATFTEEDARLLAQVTGRG